MGEIRILGRRRRLGDNIKMDYMYKPVTVKWLRVEEGGAAFDVGGTELHFKQRAGQIGTED